MECSIASTISRESHETRLYSIKKNRFLQISDIIAKLFNPDITRIYVISDMCRAGAWPFHNSNPRFSMTPERCPALEVLPDVVWFGESAAMLLGQRHLLPSGLLHGSHAEPWIPLDEISNVQPCAYEYFGLLLDTFIGCYVMTMYFWLHLDVWRSWSRRLQRIECWNTTTLADVFEGWPQVCEMVCMTLQVVQPYLG